MKALLLVIALNGCTFAGSKVTPRHVDCRAECTPTSQYVECIGRSEGTETQEIHVKGQ